jgi:GNAT superfamily N-acetyltransferase
VNGPAAELQLKTGYFGDPKAFSALVDLLRDTFDIDIGLADKFGGPDPTSMPSGYFDADGRCVANFSAFSMPLVIGGRPVRAVGYQSGAVRPEFRRRGLYRDLMRRAFAWADRQDFELGILLTDKPKLYELYGFRSVPQHAFRGTVLAATGPSLAARALSLDNADDVRLVRRLLATREPVSRVFAAGGDAAGFLLNACFDPEIRLSYLPGLDAVAAWKQAGQEFRLFDIVAVQIPTLTEIVAALGVNASEATVCFPPDRLAWQAAQPELYHGVCDLMIKPMQPVALPADPFMLSPMAEF